MGDRKTARPISQYSTFSICGIIWFWSIQLQTVFPSHYHRYSSWAIAFGNDVHISTASFISIHECTHKVHIYFISFDFNLAIEYCKANANEILILYKDKRAVEYVRKKTFLGFEMATTIQIIENYNEMQFMNWITSNLNDIFWNPYSIVWNWWALDTCVATRIHL